MDIIVNDTNIFIDLFTSGLLDEFHCLPIEVHTVDFVINELTDDEQRKAVEFFVNSNHLKVHNLSGEEILDVANFQASLTGNLSFTDCAVCHYAKKNDFTFAYELNASIEEKIEAVVKKVYGGAGVKFTDAAKKEIEILITLGDGDANATAWGCDLTYDYVKINGDYRT